MAFCGVTINGGARSFSYSKTIRGLTNKRKTWEKKRKVWVKAWSDATAPSKEAECRDIHRICKQLLQKALRIFTLPFIFNAQGSIINFSFTLSWDVAKVSAEWNPILCLRVKRFSAKPTRNIFTHNLPQSIHVNSPESISRHALCHTLQHGKKPQLSSFCFWLVRRSL